MTRINTNVLSLSAQMTLARSNAQLQTAMTRLSTGLRINAAKDDPAGLMASECLSSSTAEAASRVSAAQRQSAMIATADGALGQVSSLLDDIRGLVQQSANTGALSQEEIAANQLGIDSSLEAIHRIIATTSFAGQKLLDEGTVAQLRIGDVMAQAGRSLTTLATGGASALGGMNSQAADKVVSEVMSQVSELRGRLGAFQVATLESSMASLWTLQERLSAAQSAITDADFAAETASRTRSQILVQSGTSVLWLANSSPQRVLSLLGG